MPAKRRVLLCGASGFIGSHILTSLLHSGCQVRALYSRQPGSQSHPNLEWHKFDFSRQISQEDWQGILEEIDIVINAVGIIRQSSQGSFDRIHAAAPIALFEACQRSRISKVIQISALGADQDAQSHYHQSKYQADAALAQSSLDWTILQPSIVYGPGDHSMHFLAALASLPIIPVAGSGKQRIQPIHVDDLVQAVDHIVNHNSGSKKRIPLVGKESVTLQNLLGMLSGWYGKTRARFIHIPATLMGLVAFLGDLIPGLLFTRETWQMLQAGSVADSGVFSACFGFEPRSIAMHLKQNPARGEQKRQVGIFIWQPLLRWTVAIVWIMSAIVSVFFARSQGYHLLSRLGLSGVMLDVGLYGASLLDLVFGILVLLRYQPYRLAWLQVLLISVYTAVISIYLPMYWLDPFGALLKNLPLVAAIIIWGALEHASQNTTRRQEESES